MLSLKAAIGKTEYPPLAQVSNTGLRAAPPQVRHGRGYGSGVGRGKPRFRHRVLRDAVQRLGSFGPGSFGLPVFRDMVLVSKIDTCVDNVRFGYRCQTNDLLMST